MKNLSIILNVVLLIAVGVLYVLHFSEGSSAPATEEEVVTSAVVPSNLQLAYVNSDSLLQNYDYFKDKAEELEAKRAKLEAEYTNRAKGLQNEIADFQQNAPNMTIAQAKAVEENLTKKQQNLIRYQQSLQQQLIGEENKVNNELYDKVASYLERFGKENNYQLVLTYTKGSGVLYANDSLNITKQVIKGLNEEYNQSESTENADSVDAK